MKNQIVRVGAVFAVSVLQSSAAYLWLGTSNGLVNGSTVVNSPVNGDGVSLYAEANWDVASLPGVQAPANNAINHSAQSPAGIDAAVTVGNGGVAGGPNGAGSATALFQTNGNSVTVTGAGSGIKMAITAAGVASSFQNDNIVGGARSAMEISAGGFVSTGRLVDLAVTLSGAGSSLIFLSAGDTGLAGNNSTVDLAGGFLADSPVVSWGSITAEQLFTAGVLGSLTVNGAAAVWGSDPLVEEPGDNVLFTAEVFNRLNDGTLPQNAYYTTNRSGFSMIAIPEPGTAVLMLGGALLMFRRRRVLA
jgi:hypothetical protein